MVGHLGYRDYGYGEDNHLETVLLTIFTPEEQKISLKYLYKKDPVKYFEWKQWNLDHNLVPEVFGTKENPIDLHEEEW